MVKCPICKKVEATPMGKGWNYAAFHVELFNCPNCEKSIKVYYRDGKVSHTIPKPKN